METLCSSLTTHKHTSNHPSSAGHTPGMLQAGICVPTAESLSVSLCCRGFRQWASRGVSRRVVFSSSCRFNPPQKERGGFGNEWRTELGQMEKHHFFVSSFTFSNGYGLRLAFHSRVPFSLRLGVSRWSSRSLGGKYKQLFFVPFGFGSNSNFVAAWNLNNWERRDFCGMRPELHRLCGFGAHLLMPDCLILPFLHLIKNSSTNFSFLHSWLLLMFLPNFFLHNSLDRTPPASDVRPSFS